MAFAGVCVCVCEREAFFNRFDFFLISEGFGVVGVAPLGSYGGDGDHGGRNANGQPRGAPIPHLEAVDELLECPVPGSCEDKLRGASYGWGPDQICCTYHRGVRGGGGGRERTGRAPRPTGAQGARGHAQNLTPGK